MGGSKEKRRFYKNVFVTEQQQQQQDSDKTTTTMWEINLDKRKLKTPGGRPFNVSNELLATMIAHEWQSQAKTIKQTTMHLTTLVNTCLDNPTGATKESLVDQLSHYLENDTVLYFDAKLVEQQEKEWSPLVDWFNAQFSRPVVAITKDLIFEPKSDDQAEILTNDDEPFRAYLMDRFDLSGLLAFNYLVECMKSVVVSHALLERQLDNVEHACAVTNLETRAQNEQWGRVEWYHDVNEEETKARATACLLFIHLTRSVPTKHTKQILKNQ